MESIFVFVKKSFEHKQKVNRRYDKIKKCRYINQTEFKNHLCVRLHARAFRAHRNIYVDFLSVRLQTCT